jgi:hypothetical protein
MHCTRALANPGARLASPTGLRAIFWIDRIVEPSIALKRARAQSRAVTIALVCAALLAMTIIAFVVILPG